MEILTTKQLTKQYGTQTVVDQLNFSLNQKKCITLIGPNGAGKTTTLRMLTGLIKPTSGSISFMGKVDDHRQHIGYLPQHPVFFGWMTGEEYLLHCAKLSYVDHVKAKKRAESLFERLDIANAKHKRISTYSGGMKQRLGIAQAMIHHPKLLVLDEPVSALDPVGRREILNLIEELKQEMTILFSTHILADADEVSDDVLLLHQGKLVEYGSMTTIKERYKTERIELTFIGGAPSYHEKLQNLKSVFKVERIRDAFHVTVTDVKHARNEILMAVTEHNWDLGTFHINQASLEDIFMKVVQ